MKKPRFKPENLTLEEMRGDTTQLFAGSGRRIREYAVLLLRLAKLKHTYRELSRLLDMQITVLSRYVRGWVWPSLERSMVIVERLQPLIRFYNYTADAVKMEEGYFDNTMLISNPTFLELASYDCVRRFAGSRVTAVLTAAVDGIPLATAVALKLNAKLVVAKTYKETGVKSFIEYDELTEDGSRRTWYIPSTILHRDCVLIVDDVVRTGRMLKTLCTMAERADCTISGIYTLVTIGDGYKAFLPSGVKYETVVAIS